jgi:hypothetical protein
LIRARSMSAASKMMPWELPTLVMVLVMIVILCFTSRRRQARAVAAVNWLIETRSLPTLTRSYPRCFTFYVPDPSAPLFRL